MLRGFGATHEKEPNRIEKLVVLPENTVLKQLCIEVNMYLHLTKIQENKTHFNVTHITQVLHY